MGLFALGNNNIGNYNNRNLNADHQPSNRLEMAPLPARGYAGLMKIYKHLFQSLCSYENLSLAYKKAKKHKSKKPYVIEFEQNLQNNLYKLQWELLTHTYTPKPIKFFTVRDPKTRRIGASNFRDRIIHHALINIISPIFESRFIHDSYANRKGKGTKAALQRFDYFLRKVAKNGKLIQRERESILKTTTA